MDQITIDIGTGDALLIVPPFASTNMPYLGAHVLQACARGAGFEVKVLYANLIFASLLGEAKYEALCRAPIQCMFGERIFAAAAYGMPDLGRDDFLDKITTALARNPDRVQGIDIPELIEWSGMAVEWADRVAQEVSSLGFRVVGCTSTFEQTAPSVALLNRVKRGSPDTVTVLGGANCEGEMAQGILSLSNEIDFVFAGESEETFCSFLRGSRSSLPSNRIIRGTPCRQLDELPLVELSEFYRQHKGWLPESLLVQEGGYWACYETSRGCWWGQKRQCTFCGLNGEGIAYRQKSAQRVFSDLESLTRNYPVRRICMTDNNMPHNYFKSLLPRIAEELPGLEIFYELKANMSLDAVEALRKAGVTLVQPGIESLSTECLELMGKGVSARQNISLLRYARAAGVGLSWNILYALPGDRLASYREMLEMIPMLKHLQPPLGVSHLSIERFSRYFVDREAYRIADLSPLPVYYGIFPESADVEKLAYHFVARYPSESEADARFMEGFEKAVETWRESWRGAGELPSLALTEVGNGSYLLLDTRGLPGNRELSFITEGEAAVALLGRSADESLVQWARERKLLLEVDGVPMPLATSEPALLRRFG